MRPKSTGRSNRVVPVSYQLTGFGLNLLSRLNHAWVAEILGNIWFTVFKKTAPPWVLDFWQQADACVEVKTGDHRIPVYLWGKGPLVVMMHGWSGSGTQFRKFISPLVAAGYQVALFDAPAHGSNAGKRSDLVEFSDTLIAIQQRIGPVDTVIAHSLGAMAAVFATQRSLSIQRMILLAPHLDADKIFNSYKSLLNLNEKLARRFHRIVGEKMVEIIGHDNPWELLRPETLLANSPVPGLLIYDLDDEEVPQQLFEEIEQHWTRGRVIKTEGMGHNRLLKDEGIIQQVVDYLGKL